MIQMRLSGECPRCGDQVTLRSRRDGSNLFIGCLAYPTCRFTEPWDDRISALASENNRLRQELEAKSRLAPNLQLVSKMLRDAIVFAHPDRWPNAQEIASGVTARLNPIRKHVDP